MLCVSDLLIQFRRAGLVLVPTRLRRRREVFSRLLPLQSSRPFLSSVSRERGRKRTAPVSISRPGEERWRRRGRKAGNRVEASVKRWSEQEEQREREKQRTSLGVLVSQGRAEERRPSACVSVWLCFSKGKKQWGWKAYIVKNEGLVTAGLL